MELMKDPEMLNPAECKGVCVFAEQRRGELASVTYELLAKGRELADKLGEEFQVALLGANLDSLTAEIQNFGPDKVYVIDNAILENFQDEPYSAALCKIAREAKPAIIMAGATNLGRSFIPSAAARLGVPIISNCTGLDINDAKKLVATKPSFGGSVFSDAVIEDACPQIVTVRRKAFDPAVKKDAASGEVVKIDLPDCAASPKTKFLESVNELAGAIDLTEADVIVSGGRGIGGPEGFPMIEELAEAMGGVMGASRAAVDAGWISYSHQVGQTGKIVKPKVYVACGISGAIQHLVGMRTADVIVAINRDPEAPIFKVATYGLVGDVKQIVPALIKKFKGA